MNTNGREMQNKTKQVNIHDAAGNINIKCVLHYSPLGAISKDEYKGRTACSGTWAWHQVVWEGEVPGFYSSQLS